MQFSSLHFPLSVDVINLESLCSCLLNIDPVLKSDIRVSNALGLYSLNDNILAGTKLETILRNILTTPIAPTPSVTPSASIAPSVTPSKTPPVTPSVTPSVSGPALTPSMTPTPSKSPVIIPPSYIFYAADASLMNGTEAGDSVELNPTNGELAFYTNIDFVAKTFDQFIATRLTNNDRITTLNYSPVTNTTIEYSLNYPKGADNATKTSAFIAHPASQGTITQVKDLLQPEGFQLYSLTPVGGTTSTVDPVGTCTRNGVLYKVYYFSKRGLNTGSASKLRVETFTT